MTHNIFDEFENNQGSIDCEIFQTVGCMLGILSLHNKQRVQLQFQHKIFRITSFFIETQSTKVRVFEIPGYLSAFLSFGRRGEMALLDDFRLILAKICKSYKRHKLAMCGLTRLKYFGGELDTQVELKRSLALYDISMSEKEGDD